MSSVISWSALFLRRAKEPRLRRIIAVGEICKLQMVMGLVLIAINQACEFERNLVYSTRRKNVTRDGSWLGWRGTIQILCPAPSAFSSFGRFDYCNRSGWLRKRVERLSHTPKRFNECAEGLPRWFRCQYLVLIQKPFYY